MNEAQAAAKNVPLSDSLRPIAASELTDLLAPKRPAKSACVGQLSGANFAITGTSNWPGPDVGSSCHIAAIERTEFSIPVIASIGSTSVWVLIQSKGQPGQLVATAALWLADKDWR